MTDRIAQRGVVTNGYRKQFTHRRGQVRQFQDIEQSEIVATIDQTRDPGLPPLLMNRPLHEFLHRWAVAKLCPKTVNLAHAGILEDGAVLPQLVYSFQGVVRQQCESRQQVVQSTTKRLGDRL